MSDPPRLLEEASGIEHNQNFGDQRFGKRFAGLARDGGGDFRFARMQLSLKLIDDGQTFPQTESRPLLLSAPCAVDGSENLSFPGAVEFP